MILIPKSLLVDCRNKNVWRSRVIPSRIGQRLTVVLAIRFGQPGTRDHVEILQKYRHVILNKLYTFTCAFVESLRNSMNFFPTSLSFLISQMFIILSKSGELSLREIRCLCCDMIMTLFIGPAICEPEKHGIIADIPISTIARHNLNQVNWFQPKVKKIWRWTFRLLSFCKPWRCPMIWNRRPKISTANSKR